MKFKQLVEMICSYPQFRARVGHLLAEVHPYYVQVVKTFEYNPAKIQEEEEGDAPNIKEKVFSEMEKEKELTPEERDLLEETYDGVVGGAVISQSLVDMPFQVISMEGSSPFFRGVQDTDSMTLEAFVLVEHTPNNIDVFCLLESTVAGTLLCFSPWDKQESVEFFRFVDKRGISFDGGWLVVASARAVASDALNRKINLLATEHIPKTKVRVQTTKELDFAKIKRIIHVYPKKLKAVGIEPAFRGTLDYAYRSEVAGHWRTIDGVGKDRKGIYQVTNSTWVIDHVRGPEGAPLVRKTRVIHSEEEGAAPL